MLSRVGLAVAWLLWAALGSIPATAHDLPLDRTMNGFVKIEPRRADLVIRVPLDLLRAIQFPIDGGHYNIAAAAPVVEPAVKALGVVLPLWENDARLMPSSAAAKLAPLSDRSFEDYD